MKPITKYQAHDGREFYEKSECLRYEEQCAKIDEAITIIGDKPKLRGCQFENGKGYVRHDRDNVIKFRNRLLEIAKEILGEHRWIDQNLDDPSIHPSWVGRLISDSGHSPLSKAWDRLQCMDNSLREWGQPFYALNPDQGEHVELQPGQREDP